MKKYFILIFLSIIFVSCSSDEPTPTTIIELSRADKDLLSKCNDLAFNLLKQQNNLDANDNSNIAIAPYSISTSLSMAANYAKGDDLKRLKLMLGFENIEDLNELNRYLLSTLPHIDNKITLSIANSAWVHPNYTRAYPENFNTILQNYYNAPLYITDLGTYNGIDLLNNWCSKATNGLIPTFFDEPVSLVMLVLNANYFYGEWTNKFDKSKTVRSPFTTGYGTTEQVQTMHATLPADVVLTQHLKMATLSYGTGSFRMHLLLPDESTKLEDFINTLNGDSWNELLAQSKKYEKAAISLPKFKFSHSADFLPYFNNLTIDNPTGNSGILPISFIQQTVIIETDENGTEAAVVSGTGSAPTASDIPVLNFNRPFIFVIDEEQTGAILFTGIINNP